MSSVFGMKRSQPILRRLAMCSVLLLSGACAPQSDRQRIGAAVRSPHEGGRQDDSPNAVFRRGAGPRKTVASVGMNFDVTRIDFTLRAPRHSRKIWNHVDELRIDPEVAIRLARNGIRMGVASEESWPAIRTVVEATNARTRRDRLTPQRDLPLAINVGSVEDGESIFFYENNGRLAGQTFAGGDKVLIVEHAFRPGFGGATTLRLSLEIQRDLGVMTWQKRDGAIQQVPDVERHVFSELDATVTVNADEFLVIGLSDKADNEFLVGRRFLSADHSRTSTETIYCIAPKPYQSLVAPPRLP